MKMWRQTCEHVEAGVIVKFANNPLAMIQNLIGQGSKKIAEPRTLLGRQGGRGP